MSQCSRLWKAVRDIWTPFSFQQEIPSKSKFVHFHSRYIRAGRSPNFSGLRYPIQCNPGVPMDFHACPERRSTHMHDYAWSHHYFVFKNVFELNYSLCGVSNVPKMPQKCGIWRLAWQCRQMRESQIIQNITWNVRQHTYEILLSSLFLGKP